MTQDQETYLIIKGTIAGMPPEEQEKIMQFYNQIKEMLKENPLTEIAIALIGAELAAK